MKVYAIWVDAAGNTITTEAHVDDATGAKVLFNGAATKSNASWIGLEKEEDVTVDAGTFTNYQDAAKPTAGCSNRAQCELRYAVQNNRQVKTFSIPAVDKTYCGPAIPRIGTDPALGTVNLIDEEGVAITGFLGGKYKWAPSVRP